MWILFRKFVVGVVGTATLGVGVVVWIMPAPLGWILVPFSLIILATEFKWAQKLLRGLKEKTGPVGRKIEALEAKMRRKRRPQGDHLGVGEPQLSDQLSGDESQSSVRTVEEHDPSESVDSSGSQPTPHDHQTLGPKPQTEVQRESG